MGVVLKSTFPDIYKIAGTWKAFITDADMKYPDQNWRKICHIVDTTRPYEEVTSMGGLSVLVETGEHEDIEPDQWVSGYDYRITPKSYTKEITVSREAWDDQQDPYAKLKQWAADMVRADRETETALFASLINNAFSSLCADGTALISASHPICPEESGTVYSNILSAASPFSYTAFNQALLNFRYTKNHRNQYTMQSARYLAHPVAIGQTVQQVLTNPVEPDTMANVNIATQYQSEKVIPIELPHITSTTAWILFVGDNNDQFPLWITLRAGFETAVEKIFKKSDAFHARAYKRLGTGNPFPRGIYGSAGA